MMSDPGTYYDTCAVPKPKRRVRENGRPVDYSWAAYPKRGEIRLKGQAYQKLCRTILDRDGGCVVCKTTENLTPAHRIRRSKLRLDTPENTLVLCVTCHYQYDEEKAFCLWPDDRPEVI